MITAADVLPGNAPDNTDALALVEETSRNTGCEVAKVIGDCAYGDGATRREFKEQGCELVVKVPRGGKPGYFAKGDFKIDLEQGTVTCPAGQTTRKWQWKRVRTGPRGERVAVKQFEFAAERCRGCVHYRQCVSGKRGKGRSVTLHPEEELLQEARAYQETAAFREDTKLRQTVEHRLARLVQLGIRQGAVLRAGKDQVAVAAGGGGGESGAGGCLGVSDRDFAWSWDFFLQSAATTDFPLVSRAKSHRRGETATMPPLPRISSGSTPQDPRFPAGLLGVGDFRGHTNDS